MTKEELVKDIVEWVVENAEKESMFLSPLPCYTVSAYDLMDHLVSVSGVSGTDIEAWSNAVADRKDGVPA